LIDVLGQKALLEEHRYLTETAEGCALLETKKGREEFSRIQSETHNRVLGLREIFKMAIERYSSIIVGSNNKNKLFLEDQCKINATVKPMSYQFFSDTIIIYAPLESKDELIMRYRIAATFFACMSIMLKRFAQDVFFRGGIEIGVGQEFPDNGGLYGLVLNDVHCLESKIAQYPRIVVGNNLVKLIQCGERNTTYSNFCTGLNNRLDEFGNSVITKDKDGKYIIDFLGKTFADLCIKTFPNKSQSYVGAGIKSIAKEYNKYLSKGNHKLTERYELLKEYYFERLGNWGPQQTTIEK
jgi:hypothetical protein